MKKLEMILGIIVLMGLIFKITLIPGGGILLTLSLLTLACLYYPLGFAFFNKIELKKVLKKDSYIGLSVLRIIGSIGLGMALSATCVGILFKIQRWSGAYENLIAGLICTLIVLIIALIKYYKTKGEFFISILKRIAVIGIGGLIIFSISYLTIIKIEFRDHPDYIKAYELYLNDPSNEILKKNKDLEFYRATLSKEDFEIYLKQTEKQ